MNKNKKKKRSEIWDSLSDRSKLILSMHDDFRFDRYPRRGFLDDGFFGVSHFDPWMNSSSICSYEFAVRRLYIHLKYFLINNSDYTKTHKIVKAVEAYDAEQRAKKLNESTVEVSNQTQARGRL